MIEQPPIQPTPVGALRFNTDSKQLEYFDGGQYVNITTDSPSRNTGGTRGLFCRGRTPSNVDTIDFVNIDSTGNAIDFGNGLSSNRQAGATGSRSRAVMNGRDNYSNVIEFLTFASQGDTQDFGDATVSRAGSPQALSDGTRGIFSGGEIPSNLLNVIDYVTISQLGNAVDFGDLSSIHSEGARASNGTRGVIIAGRKTSSSPYYSDAIDYITISSTGNSSDFGDAIEAKNEVAGDSNAIRGVYAGGQTGSNTNRIEFLTIATQGSTEDFGDIATASTECRGSASPTRFVFNHGYENGYVTTISYVQIMTTGNAIDFGDLTQARGQAAGVSNGHGGLG